MDDDEPDGNIAGRIELGLSQSDDAAFAGIDPPDVTLTNIDDEQVAIIVVPEDPVRTSEDGDSAAFSIALNHAPTAPVRVELTASDPSEWRLDRTQVELTADNWDAGAEVVVTGVDDDEVDGPIIGTIRLSAAVSADARYDGIDPPDLPAINLDNDIAGGPEPPIEPAPIPVPILERWWLTALTLLLLVSATMMVRTRKRFSRGACHAAKRTANLKKASHERS